MIPLLELEIPCKESAFISTLCCSVLERILGFSITPY